MSEERGNSALNGEYATVYSLSTTVESSGVPKHRATVLIEPPKGKKHEKLTGAALDRELDEYAAQAPRVNAHSTEHAVGSALVNGAVPMDPPAIWGGDFPSTIPISPPIAPVAFSFVLPPVDATPVAIEHALLPFSSNKTNESDQSQNLSSPPSPRLSSPLATLTGASDPATTQSYASQMVHVSLEGPRTQHIQTAFSSHLNDQITPGNPELDMHPVQSEQSGAEKPVQQEYAHTECDAHVDSSNTPHPMSESIPIHGVGLGYSSTGKGSETRSICTSPPNLSYSSASHLAYSHTSQALPFSAVETSSSLATSVSGTVPTYSSSSPSSLFACIPAYASPSSSSIHSNPVL